MKARISMETVTFESIPITLGREDDGRWWADSESMPGVMAYGDTQEPPPPPRARWRHGSPPIASITARKFPRRSRKVFSVA